MVWIAALCSGRLDQDVVFDALGRMSVTPSEKMLAAGGSLVTVQKGLARGNTDDLLFLKGHCEAGEIRPVIDRHYPLAQVAQAHEYVEQSHKVGERCHRV
jgi:NADPH:quinone reductase-like Zn-dependent oxidoreductase